MSVYNIEVEVRKIAKDMEEIKHLLKALVQATEPRSPVECLR